MNVIRMSATSGPDGVLHLSVPIGAAGEYEVAVVIAPRPTANGVSATGSSDEFGWPPGFLDKTFGSIQDEAFKRYPQSDFEKR